MAELAAGQRCGHCRQEVEPVLVGGKHYCPNCGSVWLRKHSSANRSMVRGWLLRVVGVGALIVGSVIDFASLRYIRDAIGWLGGAVAFMTGSGLLVAGYFMWSRGKKLLAGSADEALARDSRPPVVYLRSFQDDTTAAQPISPPIFGGLSSWGFTEEEQLAKVLSKIGPFIAIGRPGDDLPDLGAARIYVPDERWRDTIVDYMSKARLVVLRIGATEGLWWELQQAVRILSPLQLAFLVPHDHTAYEAFRQQANTVLPLPLPHQAGPKARRPRGDLAVTLQGQVASQLSLRGVIYFTSDWAPQVALFEVKHAIGTPRVALGPFMYGLRPVFRQLGVPWRWIGRTTLAWIGGSALFIGLILLAWIFPE